MSVEWVESAQLSVNSVTLEYACFGPPPSQAPTLVLLHEGLGSAGLWRDFPNQLVDATGFGVCAYSRAGYGCSDPVTLPRPLNYMTREATDVLPLVLDAIGFSQGILIGHSDGATIAAIHAGDVCDPRVLGIVLMAPHFFTEAKALSAISGAKLAYESNDLKLRLTKYHRDPDNAFYGWNDSWLHPDFRQWNVTSVLESLHVPVLAVQGLQDQYGTLAQIDIIEKKCPMPVNKLLLDDCRHSPFLDCPSKVLEEITRFCVTVTSTPATHI
jgi:pimeloyl-ACP methyl ester carboxylesterase